LAQQQTDAALRTAESARLLTQDVNTLGRLALLRSDIQYARSQTTAALVECAEACRLVPGDVEYLLRRSQLQAELGDHEARLKDLQSACQANPSVVLSNERIEAQIDAGQAETALVKIEKELAESRWRSSWLIRRARANRELGDLPAARRDLEAAIAEINTRLNPERPDVTLLVDRGLAYAMLGETSAAQADLAAASAAHGGRALLYRLNKELQVASPEKSTSSSISTPTGATSATSSLTTR
jgi:tetratricopeptide (TPR) repeat protein